MICTLEHWDFKTIFSGLLWGRRPSNFRAFMLILFLSKIGIFPVKYSGQNTSVKWTYFLKNYSENKHALEQVANLITRIKVVSLSL